MPKEHRGVGSIKLIKYLQKPEGHILFANAAPEIKFFGPSLNSLSQDTYQVNENQLYICVCTYSYLDIYLHYVKLRIHYNKIFYINHSIHEITYCKTYIKHTW